MTELEKLKAGLFYNMDNEEVNNRKLTALKNSQELNKIETSDNETLIKAIKNLFGSVGKNPFVAPVFNCDYGKNIFVGDNFLTNYNVTILDIGEVRIGNNVMIGPGTLITTVNHPIDPKGR